MITTNCSNNYGPCHFPEKLIPLMIVNALAGKPLPIYGDGMQVRDWLYVKDHCSAIRRVLEAGRLCETYIRKTVQWYLANPEWVANVQSGAYRFGW